MTKAKQPQPVRKRPIRTFTAKLDGEYEGTEAVMIANPPMQVMDDIAEREDFNNLDKIRVVLRKLTVSWNFVDENGVEVPLDDTCSGLTADEIYQLLSAYYVGRREAAGLPKENDDVSESTTPSSTSSLTSETTTS